MARIRAGFFMGNSLTVPIRRTCIPFRSIDLGNR
jgi:hypothetical protein